MAKTYKCETCGGEFETTHFCVGKPYRTIDIPKYEDVSENVEKGQSIGALDQFILNNEPAGVEDEEAFRKGLTDAIDEVQRQVAFDTRARFIQARRLLGELVADISEMDAEEQCDAWEASVEFLKRTKRE